jgi:predicted MPP superfamily phosphohydrolase
VGDVHLPEGPEPLTAFNALLLEVKAAKPDLVVFVGDYTANPRDVVNMPEHRENIINAFKLVDPIPRAIVLGNYESWSDEATLFPKFNTWLTEFSRLGVDALENETRMIATDNGPICVRGFGDKYTNRFEYIDYPEKCRNLPKVSITHDPAGAFEEGVKGVVIAGHTHCGQVSFPFLGPLWVPSDAPSELHFAD